jgi:DNA-binding MarR family transcriptional regulator
MKIIISWFDEKSHAVADALGDWVPSVIQAVETSVSPEGIRKGTNWLKEVSEELNESSSTILCIISSNIGDPWLNFELGVLSTSLDMSKVIMLFIGAQRAELDSGPLTRFPSAVFEKSDLFQMMEMINASMEKGKLSKGRLQKTFEVWWPKLAQDVESVEGETTNPAPRIEKPEKAPEPAVEPAKNGKAMENPEVVKPAKQEPVKAAKQEVVKPVKQEVVKPVKLVASRPALDETEIEILRMLDDSPENTPKTAAEVGYKFDITAQNATEFLEKLERENYVREHLFIGRPKEYSVAPKGREYLTKQDELNRRQG